MHLYAPFNSHLQFLHKNTNDGGLPNENHTIKHSNRNLPLPSTNRESIYIFREKTHTIPKTTPFSTLIFLNIEKPLTLIFKKFPQEATTTKTMNIAYCFQEAR